MLEAIAEPSLRRNSRQPYSADRNTTEIRPNRISPPIHKTMKATLFSLVVAAGLVLWGVVSASPKTYQVTGPIIEMSDSMIVVEKRRGNTNAGKIARDSSTKTKGETKVGDKVTVTYTMTATEIEAKGAARPAKTSVSPSAPPKSKIAEELLKRFSAAHCCHRRGSPSGHA
jgi:hypothetical protein